VQQFWAKARLKAERSTTRLKPEESQRDAHPVEAGGKSARRTHPAEAGGNSVSTAFRLWTKAKSNPVRALAQNTCQ